MIKEKQFCYNYQRPSYTADCMVFNKFSDDYKILLIKRKNEPFKGFWAFPGGFVNAGETNYDAAKRELKEETGLEVDFLKEFHVFDKAGRDPRGWTVTVVRYCFLENKDIILEAGDDASEVKWFSINGLPDLAFDHKEIIEKAINEISEFKN